MPNVASMSIAVINTGVIVEFFSEENSVYRSEYSNEKFMCANNSLTLKLNKQQSSGGLTYGYIHPQLILYKSKSDDVYVELKEKSYSAVIMVPVISDKNYWLSNARITDHIFVSDKAEWDKIADDANQHDGHICGQQLQHIKIITL